MSIVLKLSVKLDDDFPNYDPDDSLNCVFRDNILVVDNVHIPIDKKTPIGLFAEGKVSEWVSFKTLSTECWCGCDNRNNLLFFTIEAKQFVLASSADQKPSYSLMKRNDEVTDDETMVNALVQAILDFPMAAVVKHYGNYAYDTHWDCRCKYQEVCGCGCDSDHDGW